MEKKHLDGWGERSLRVSKTGRCKRGRGRKTPDDQKCLQNDWRMLAEKSERHNESGVGHENREGNSTNREREKVGEKDGEALRVSVLVNAGRRERVTRRECKRDRRQDGERGKEREREGGGGGGRREFFEVNNRKTPGQ